jgi:hypothetical protein
MGGVLGLLQRTIREGFCLIRLSSFRFDLPLRIRGGHQLNFDLVYPSSAIPKNFFPSNVTLYGKVGCN